MKLFEALHSFEAPWHTVTYANWNKYPNPFSSHVISCDTLSRRVDPESQLLITERLLCCRQPVPSILARLGLGFQEQAYFHEISPLNLETREFTAQTVNLTMRSLLNVSETCVLTVDPNSPSNTLFKQQAQVSAMGVFASLGRLIEEVAVNRFSANAAKGREALASVTSKLWSEALELEQKMSSSLDQIKSNFVEGIGLNAEPPAF